MGATDMVLKLNFRHLRSGIEYLGDTAHWTTTKDDIHGIIQVRERKDAGRIVVTRIFPQPSRIEGIGIKITGITYHRTCDRTDTRLAYFSSPTIEKTLVTHVPRAKSRITTTLYVEIAVQDTILNITGIRNRSFYAIVPTP